MYFNTLMRGAVAGGQGYAQQLRFTDRDLATWQAIQYDPNSVLQSVQMNGRYLKARLQNHATVSRNPNTGVSWSAPIHDLYGNAAVMDILTLLNTVAFQTLDDDPPGADIVIGAGAGNGPVQTMTQGFAVALFKSGSDWKVRKYVCAAGTWTATDATAVSASVVGARLLLFSTNSSVQRGCCIQPFDTNGNPVTTLNIEPINTTTSTQSDQYTHVFSFAGWDTGSGGSDGTQVTLRANEMVLRMTQITKYERSNPPF
jgi:hypothetical protein